MEWAWFTGIFEGEGSIAFTGKNSVAVAIGMTDLDVIQRVKQIAGAGAIYLREHERNKPMHYWKVHRAPESKRILEQMLPLLGERRGARAEGALERLKSVRKEGFCKRGHPMSGPNLYVSPGSGQRLCKACSRMRDKNRQPRNRPRSPKAKAHP